MVADTPALGKRFVYAASETGAAGTFFPLTKVGGGQKELGFCTQIFGFRMISGIPLLQGQRRRARVHLG